jgi:hypothetical protein
MMRRALLSWLDCRVLLRSSLLPRRWLKFGFCEWARFSSSFLIEKDRLCTSVRRSAVLLGNVLLDMLGFHFGLM